MKKIVTALLVLLVSVTAVSAAGTELYQMEGHVWQSAASLCIANGVLPPPAVSPATGADIENALLTIPQSELDPDEKRLYDSIMAELNGDMALESTWASMEPWTAISPEMFVQSQKLEKRWDYLWDVKDRLPFINLGMEVRVKDWAYAYGNWTVLSPGLANVHQDIFTTNLSQKMEFQHEGMLDGGILIGNGLINGGVLRSRQEMGYGITGNLMVGDNFSRQDYMRLNLRTDWFNYTLNFTHFDQEKDIASTEDEMVMVRPMFNGMHTHQGIHRFEFKFAKKVSFVVQEGLMIHTSSPFDIRFLSPFIFFHGYFNNGGNQPYEPGKTADEANNYMSFELGWVIAPHVMMNVHFLLDQLQLPGEGAGKTSLPHAYAAILNVESPWVVGDHWINAWYESAFVMPYTYLNLKKTDGKFNTNLDMVVGYKNYLQDDIGYAGYKWGSDSIVNAIGVTWGLPGEYEADASLTWLIHGQYGYGYKKIIAERGEEHFTDMMLAGVGFRNAEHRIMLKVDAKYTPFDWLTVKAGLGWVSIINLATDVGKNVNDLQFKIGVSFDPMGFID